ncbi:MAG: DUF2334 domain-containing protein [Fibrobacteres bacterium]|nr:DUF2334 domain-containing protein [Fibrobacterota bacterium]
MDPSYYYGLKRAPKAYFDSAIGEWRTHGINSIFFKAYDPEYGAVYHTRYPGNSETDYGKEDLLRIVLDAAHKRGVRVIGWLPAFEHKGAWEAHPEWRIQGADGKDFLPAPDRHFLCPRQPGFAAWWRGFVSDLLERYPDLDGVDFAEPMAVWGRQVCHCPLCLKETAAGAADALSPLHAALRAQAPTDLLLASSKLVKAAGRSACVTFIGTAGKDGSLFPFSKQKELSGLDVDRLLDSPDRPQWVSVELMWQQWADSYDNPATFRPDWTRHATEQALADINARAHLLVHVEITPLGPVEVSPDELAESMVAARRGGAQSIEFYDTHLVDSLGAWPGVEKAWRTQSERKALVLHDPGGLGVARQVATLFGHFGLTTRVTLAENFADSLVGPNDLVAYVGNKDNHPLPEAFLRFAAKPGAKIFWADFNLWQLDRPLVRGHGDTATYKDTAKGIANAPSNGTLARLGLKWEYHDKSGTYNTVLYHGQELYKTDSILNHVAILDSSKAKVLASVKSQDGGLYPYMIRSGNFWFVADCPTDYIVEGGRDAVFADALHDFVGEDHPVAHTALVRIEDVCPLTDPGQMKAIADLLHGEGVPWSIALVPYYVDPEENAVVTMQDKPEFVKAIHYSMEHGAAIVMHGSTHQYRGRSTHDYEFWDALHDTPLFEDSREYVRTRIQRGIDVMRKEGIYPIAWETPHYAGSQLDYSVADQFFSAEYGRRQVIDKTGFDQLVPYFIGRHPSGNSIIPENLGYIPNDRQESAPLLRCAQNNLAVRDGFGSFFFHPWIDRKVLKELVRGLKAQGYRFADIRAMPLKMQAQGVAQVSGSQEIDLDGQGKWLHAFYLDDAGKRHEEWTSQGPVNLPFRKTVRCPPGWTYVVEAIDKPAGWLSRITPPDAGLLGKARSRLFAPPPLKLAKGEPARALILWSPPGQDLPAMPNVPADTAAAAHLAAHLAGRAHAVGHFPPSQEAWTQALQAAGIQPDSLRLDRFLEVPEAVNLVVVPARTAALLSTQQALMLAQWVAKGKNVILEGPSETAEHMGIHATDSGRTVSELKDDYLPQVPIKWPQPSPYYAFDADVEYVNEYSTPDDKPLVAGGEYGEGKYIFFAVPFAAPAAAPSSASAAAPAAPAQGPYRFPFLLDLIEREFNVSPALRSPELEVYFDPGSREDIPLEELVKNWHKNGVRAVYAAAWHEYAKYTFEYGYLADLLHKNGIMAYAWMDLPEVSDKFWHEHPAWREKTAAGTDAEMDSEIGWKQYMDFANDTARAGAYNDLKRILLMAPWDGAVLTGRMFAGTNPGDSLQHITPFNPGFRARYRADKGYDPLAIFDSKSPQFHGRSMKAWNEFSAYRDSVEIALLSDAVDFLKKQRPLQKPGAEIVVTRPFAGANDRELAWQQALITGDARVHLQAALPSAGMDADVLDRMLASWSGAHPGWKPMVELHFDVHKPASGITPQLCGVELMALVARAAREGTRLTLRTEDYIYDTDFRDLAYAAGSRATESFAPGAWDLDSPGRSTLDLDFAANPEVMVDGQLWPAYDRGRLLVPEGRHRIEACSRLTAWRTFLLAPARITGFNGGIADARTTLQGVRLRYDSPVPAALAMNMAPVSATLDGLPFQWGPAAAVDADKGKGGKPATVPTALDLPAGSHDLVIITRPLASSLMRQASFGISIVIIVISVGTVLAFLLLYLGGWLKRLYSGEEAAPGSHPAPKAPPTQA